MSQNINNNQNNLFCPHHEQTFSSFSGYKTHMFEKHKITIEPKTKGNLMCNNCELRFKYNYQRIDHYLKAHELTIEKEEIHFSSKEGKSTFK